MLIQEEVEQLVEVICSYEGKPINPEDDILAANINIISALVSLSYSNLITSN